MQNELRRQIRVLRLQAGDIVVVQDLETANRLQQCPAKWPCPILIAPLGVERMDVPTLRRALEDAEKRAQKPSADTPPNPECEASADSGVA